MSNLKLVLHIIIIFVIDKLAEVVARGKNRAEVSG